MYITQYCSTVCTVYVMIAMGVPALYLDIPVFTFSFNQYIFWLHHRGEHVKNKLYTKN